MSDGAPAERRDPLALLREREVLSDLDVYFARFMSRLHGRAAPVSAAGAESQPEMAGALELAAALASRATAQGDVCVNLRQWAWRWNAGAVGSAAVASPPIDEWLKNLRASPVVGWPGERHPLILDRRGRLYLYRYWGYERQLAGDLLERTNTDLAGTDEARLRADLDRLFPCLLYTSRCV